MAVTYTWTIPTVERNLSDGGITVIHWRCDGVDGDYTASSYGTTSHTPDADAADFIAYDSVTEANCIAWAQAALDQDAIETAIADNIGVQKTPTTGSGTPWAA
jgi:hypothetical protein